MQEAEVEVPEVEKFEDNSFADQLDAPFELKQYEGDPDIQDCEPRIILPDGCKYLEIFGPAGPVNKNDESEGVMTFKFVFNDGTVAIGEMLVKVKTRR